MTYEFNLDDFQIRAIQAVENDNSVVVSAPTGSGKTVIAEHVITKSLNQNKGVIYTAPIKALSNQKFREFEGLFPEQVGIITGDVNINPQAPILIMTTEIFRNGILENKERFSQHSWIIFDEIHFLDDFERGTVWEESLIFLPPHMHFVGLSATIPNIDEFVSWIKNIHSYPIKVIKEFKRPVPLHFFFQCCGKIVDELKQIKKIGYGHRKTVYFKNNHGKKNVIHLRPSRAINRPTSLIHHLLKSNRLPCIYFTFSRKRCEYLAKRVLGFDFISEEEKNNILDLYDHLCRQLKIAESERAIMLRSCVERGIAYHHAGIHPMLKEIIERLFSEKYIKVIFTTETFALGINMPARTVVIDELRKKYGRYFRVLKTRDFYQMAGRSGRRGIDHEGFVYSRVKSDELSFRELEYIFRSKPEPILSRFNVSYATILNLYELYQESLLEIYPLSFHYFQEKNKNHNIQLRQMKLRLKILKKLNYIQNSQLTKKGGFAKKVYGYELPISELFSSGFLEELNERQLGILCLAIVYEPRPKTKKPPLTRELKFLRSQTSRITRKIHLIEKKIGVSPISKSFYFDLSYSLIEWMGGRSFEKILEKLDFDEGEVIRFYRMGVQILREILETPISTELKKKVNNTIQLINRGVIDAEDQLKQIVDIELK